ncbi:MAG TPA: hypothetical protein VGB85_08285 [Nannocystis sp.]
MRTRLLLIATLATLTAACGYRVDNCDQPSKGFSLDEELDERAVELLVRDSRVIDHTQLECDMVCELIYLDQNPKGGATEVEVCDLVLDGDFTGDPDAVVGSIYCEGRGIPQFCVDA